TAWTEVRWTPWSNRSPRRWRVRFPFRWSMSKLSAYVLTFNEEEKIRDALESIKWADEIVVLDSHSTDRTEQICKEYTDRFYQCDFEGCLPLLVRHVLELRLPGDADVVDEHVQAAEGARRLGNGTLGLAGLRQVGRDVDGLADAG